VSYSSSNEEVYSDEIPLPINADIDVKVSSVHLILNIGFINRAIVSVTSDCLYLCICGIVQEFIQSVSVDSRILKKFGRVVADAANAVRYIHHKMLHIVCGNIAVSVVKVPCDKMAYNSNHLCSSACSFYYGIKHTTLLHIMPQVPYNVVVLLK